MKATEKRVRTGRDHVVQAVLSPETNYMMERVLEHRRKTAHWPLYSVTQLIRDLIIESHRELEKIK